MSKEDTRYGNCPFPYGPNYDRGISLNRVVGVANDPRGLTEGQSYAAITMHKNYEEHVLAQFAGSGSGAERTIYINTSLLGPAYATNALVTIRMGESFQNFIGAGHISGQVAGVVNENGLIGLFSWRRSNGTLEWFPDRALKVFDAVLTAEDINETSWAGEDAYSAATTGAPLYYFFWNAVRGRLNGPVRRVLPEEVGGDVSSQSIRAFGVFVPVESGVPQSPIPCFAILHDWLMYGDSCGGYVAMSATELESEASEDVNIGSAELEDTAVFGPSGGASTTDDVWGRAAVYFDYYTEFSDAATEGYISGYFFIGWYDPGLGISDSGQNTNKLFLSGAVELGRIFLLDSVLSFSGGTPTAPNPLYLILTPLDGQEPSSTTQLEFSIGNTEETGDGTACALMASAYTGVDGSRAVYCYGTFHTSMWINVESTKKIRYKELYDGTKQGQLLEWDGTGWSGGPVGSLEGQVLVWNESTTAWVAGTPEGLPTGTTAGQLLIWNATDTGDAAWEPGPYGTEEGQALVWNATASIWEAGIAMPTGDDKNTLFFDGGLETPGWTANAILTWDKYVNSTAASTGGDLIIDLTGCNTRAWDAQMPGIAILHPSGGTCGLFANVEGGADAGARLDMGWGGAYGGNFELYANTHPTRPGEFRIIYGPTGHIEFKNYRGTSDWEVTAGLTKEGRFFCGFNDSGFPGSEDTYGTYAAPPYPFQVYDETSHASKMTAGITKEGRGFFGLGGTMPTAGVEHPLEIYNEAGTGIERVAFISKDGKLYGDPTQYDTGSSLDLTHTNAMATWNFATDATSYERVKIRVLTDGTRWDVGANKLIKAYRDITLPKAFVSHISAETDVDVITGEDCQE